MTTFALTAGVGRQYQVLNDGAAYVIISHEIFVYDGKGSEV